MRTMRPAQIKRFGFHYTNSNSVFCLRFRSAKLNPATVLPSVGLIKLKA